MAKLKFQFRTNYDVYNTPTDMGPVYKATITGYPRREAICYRDSCKEALECCLGILMFKRRHYEKAVFNRALSSRLVK